MLNINQNNEIKKIQNEETCFITINFNYIN